MAHPLTPFAGAGAGPYGPERVLACIPVPASDPHLDHRLRHYVWLYHTHPSQQKNDDESVFGGWRRVCDAPWIADAQSPLDPRDWRLHSSVNPKTQIPRILLAKYHTHQPEQVQQVEKFLLALNAPWGEMGSTYFLNPRGDYDFSAIVVAYLTLKIAHHNPSAVKDMRRVVSALLPNANQPWVSSVPYMPVHVTETENHLLMMNGCHYLTNLFKVHYDAEQHKDLIASGLLEQQRKHLLKFLQTILHQGLWEFNARPYTTYTMLSLLVLEEVGEVEVSVMARRVLDLITFSFALGCSKMRRSDPFRRRPDHNSRNLYSHPLTAMMLYWLYDHLCWNGLDTLAHHPTPGYSSMGEELGAWKTIFTTQVDFEPVQNPLTIKPHVAGSVNVAGSSVYAAHFRYHPPADTCLLAWGTPPRGSRYFVTLGHGNYSCPETYFVTDAYMLSGGGSAVDQDFHRNVVARPIALVLHDQASTTHDDVPHITVNSNTGSNNSGVVMNFACSSGEFKCPSKTWTQTAVAKPWSVYRPSGAGLVEGKQVALVVGQDKGVVVWLVSRMPPADDAAVVAMMRAAKPQIRTRDAIVIPPILAEYSDDFYQVSFDVRANCDRWAIVDVNHVPVIRDFARLPLIDIHGHFRGKNEVSKYLTMIRPKPVVRLTVV